MLACFFGHKNVVKLLLDNSDKIDLNARDNDGVTAYMKACTKGHKDVVKLLLKYPKVVDIKIPDNFQISEEIQSLIDMHSMTASVCTP